MTLMYEDSPLTRLQRELIGAYTSYLNKCEYCIIHHYEALQHNWKDAPPMTELAKGKGLDNQNLALIKYLDKLTLTPWEVEETDVERLKKEGFSDRAVLDIALICGYFNFVNRLVLGVGVSLEDDSDRNYNY